MKKFWKEAVVFIISVVLISGAASAVVAPEKSTNMNVQKENTINWISSARENLPQDFIEQSTLIPFPPSVWLHYDDGTNVDALGLTNGGTFEYGIRLTPTELAGYGGLKFTTVKHHHGYGGSSAPSVSGYVNIYDEGTASSPGALLLSDPYTTANVPGWEEYTLSSPIIIDETRDLWVCLKVTHLAGEYPAGMDPGPAVDGKGDWIFLDPGPWAEIQTYGFDYNWNLWAGLEDESPCEPGIDVEKYVLGLDGKWVDADTENEALDLPICHDGQFKIVIKNTGECALINIVVKDIMHESLKYTGADPEPDNVVNTPPEWVMDWMFPGPLAPGDTIEIYVNFHVEGPECSVDYNHVLVEGFCEECPGDIVQDEDWCWVHAYKKSKDLNMPFLQFLQSHPNIFPLLQKLLKTLGL